MRRKLEQFFSRCAPDVKVVLFFPALVYFVCFVVVKHKTTIKFLLIKGRIKSFVNFMLAKLFVREEGGALFDPFLRLLPKFAPLPWSIEVEVTTKCDKKCIICEHTYWDEQSKDLSFDDFKKILSQTPRLIWFNPTGEGEAFLNKDFLRMLRYLKSKSIFVFFNDSFDKINEEVARQLIEIGVDRIEVSMQGATKQTYEKIMVGHNFDKALNNLKTMIRFKKEMKSPLPELCFHYIITTLNIPEIPRFIELIHSLGGKNSFGVGSYVNFSGLLEFEEIKDMVAEVPAEIMEEADRKAKQLKIGIMWTHHIHSEKEKSPIKECVAWSQPYVLMGGDVVSCCAVLMSNRRPFLRKHSFGNLLQQSLKDIWTSKRYKKFRQMVPKDKGKVPILCQGCRVFRSTCRQKHYGVSRQI